MVVDDVGNELGMSQGLIEPAHDAEADMLVTSLHEAGNDGMERALAAGKRIGRRGVKREKGAAILQGESHAQNSYVRSKVVVVALDHGKDIAFAIDDREVGSIASTQRPRCDRAIRFSRVDE